MAVPPPVRDISTVTGLPNIYSNLRKEIAKIEGATRHGLLMAANKVKADAQNMTPVDTGHLRGGAQAAAADTPKGPSAVIRYEAEYAVYVHEGHSRVEGRGRKFLERSVVRNLDNIVQIIRARARI